MLNNDVLEQLRIEVDQGDALLYYQILIDNRGGYTHSRATHDRG